MNFQKIDLVFYMSKKIETDITKRWELGMPHHPKSKEIYKAIAENDWKYGGNYFDWEAGGDGDNGEHLMYLLDIYFEQIYESNSERPAYHRKNKINQWFKKDR